MSTDPRIAIAVADVALDIELDPTRIKAAPINSDYEVLVTDGRGQESHLEDDLWPYTFDEVVTGLRVAYASLVAGVCKYYDVIPVPYGSIGISVMMHGYLVFDAKGDLLVSFRTWHSTNMGYVADKFTHLFGFNIPLRWSIAHLRQAVLGSEEHAPHVARLTTLAGWVHHQLTGRHILDIGDASGMLPIDSEAGTYMEFYLNQYEVLVEARVPWRLRDVLPTVLSTGEDAGALTPEGVALIDPTGTPQAGIALCPPGGDAGTGMITTNTIAQRTGNISCGTSVFLVVILERSPAELHTEIDVVVVLDGSPVAMVRLSSGASELDAWTGWFADFARLVGADVSVPMIRDALYNHALMGEADADGVMVCDTLFTEPLISQRVAQPVFTHTADAHVSLTNTARAQLTSISAVVRIGADILRGEGMHLDSLFAHGGLLKAPGVVQQIPADSLNVPVFVGDIAGGDDAWGTAMLVRYRAVLARDEATPALPNYLPKRAFVGVLISTLEPTHEGVAGYGRFLGTYHVALPDVETITRGSVR